MRLFSILTTIAIFSLASPLVQAERFRGWIDPSDPDLPAEFAVQGEYAGEIRGGEKLGAQVIALGDGWLHVVILTGGLPGAGWDGENRILLEGQLAEGETTAKLVPAELKGKRKLSSKNPEEFSPTKTFPPMGHQRWNGEVGEGLLSGKTEDGNAFRLEKIVRESPTLGAKPPEGAVVLFDGTSADQFAPSIRKTPKHDLMSEGGLLREGVDSKRKFHGYSLHVEFRTPFRPDQRGQGRGNSGCYAQGRYEVQILDSFGLEPGSGDCGGIYGNAPPAENMCLPPLVWQTFDIDFTPAEFDEKGERVSKARLTVRHNGVLIHDDVEVKGATASHIIPEGPDPGPVHFQNHENPVRFRNIWLMEKKQPGKGN